VWLTPPQEDGQLQAQLDRAGGKRRGERDPHLVLRRREGHGAIDRRGRSRVPVYDVRRDAPRLERFSFYGVDDRRIGQDVMAELAS